MKSPRTLLLADLFLQGLLSLFKSMAVASVGIIALMFFFNYGKPYDWFHSPVIAACSVIAPLLLGAFLWRMTDPPKSKFYITISTLNTRFLINVLNVDTLHAYSLNVWQLPVSSLDSTLQMQGLLLSVKDILGMMMVAALVVAVASAFIPFHKAVRVKVVKTGEDMV